MSKYNNIHNVQPTVSQLQIEKVAVRNACIGAAPAAHVHWRGTSISWNGDTLLFTPDLLDTILSNYTIYCSSYPTPWTSQNVLRVIYRLIHPTTWHKIIKN